MQDPLSTDPNQPGFLWSNYRPFDNAYRNSKVKSLRTLFDAVFGCPIGHSVGDWDRFRINERIKELRGLGIDVPDAIFAFGEIPSEFYPMREMDMSLDQFPRDSSLIVPAHVEPFAGLRLWNHSRDYTEGDDLDPQGVGCQFDGARERVWDIGSIVNIVCPSTAPVTSKSKRVATMIPGVSDTKTTSSGTVMKTFVKVMVPQQKGFVRPIWECTEIR